MSACGVLPDVPLAVVPPLNLAFVELLKGTAVRAPKIKMKYRSRRTITCGRNSRLTDPICRALWLDPIVELRYS